MRIIFICKQDIHQLWHICVCMRMFLDRSLVYVYERGLGGQFKRTPYLNQVSDLFAVLVMMAMLDAKMIYLCVIRFRMQY